MDAALATAVPSSPWPQQQATEAHPSVLISVLPHRPHPRKQEKDVSSLPQESSSTPLSGCGFIYGRTLKNGETSLVTTASWLSSIVEIKLSDSSTRTEGGGKVTWQYRNQPLDQVPKIVVLMQRAPDSTGKRATFTMEADIVDVCLMTDVFYALNNALTSLSHWRIATGETTDTGVISLSSLVLPLSCLVIVKLRSETEINSCCSLGPTRSTPSPGQSIRTVCTPFGAFCPEVFLNSLTSGSICKVIGSDRSVFVTDTNLPPGCEGSLIVDALPLTVTGLKSPCEAVGMVIACLSSLDGHPSGLSLSCSAQSIWETLRKNRVEMEHLRDEPSICSQRGPPLSTPSTNDLSPLLMESIVIVCSCGQWGSGVLLSDTVVLTCKHVAKDNKDISILLQDGTRYSGELFFSCSTPDIALIKLALPLTPAAPQHTLLSSYSNNCHHSIHSSPAIKQDKQTRILTDLSLSKSQNHSSHLTTFTSPSCPVEGMKVLILGLGCQDPYKTNTANFTPLVTKGTIVKVVRGEGGDAVMCVTTAVLLPGMSGGLVVEELTGEPIGMAVSNSKDVENGFSYPRVNYCLPFSWTLPPLVNFMLSGDHTHLRTLTSMGQENSHIWKLESRYMHDINKFSFVQSKL